MCSGNSSNIQYTVDIIRLASSFELSSMMLISFVVRCVWLSFISGLLTSREVLNRRRHEYDCRKENRSEVATTVVSLFH